MTRILARLQGTTLGEFMLLGALVLAVGLGIGLRSGESGSLEVRPTALDLGYVSPQTKKTLDFTVENRTGRAMRIGVVSSCACSDVRPRDFALIGFEALTCKITVDTAGKSGFNRAQLEFRESGRVAATAEVRFFVATPYRIVRSRDLVSSGRYEPLAEVYCLSENPAPSIVVSSAIDAIETRVIQRCARHWTCEGRWRERPENSLVKLGFAEAGTADAAGIGELPYHVVSTPIGEIRSARCGIGDKRRRIWVLVEPEYEVSEVACKAVTAETGDAVSFASHGMEGTGKDRVMWVEVEYESALIGRTASMLLDSSVGQFSWGFRLL